MSCQVAATQYESARIRAMEYRVRCFKEHGPEVGGEVFRRHIADPRLLLNPHHNIPPITQVAAEQWWVRLALNLASGGCFVDEVLPRPDSIRWIE
jgi:hypothetical protein